MWTNDTGDVGSEEEDNAGIKNFVKNRSQFSKFCLFEEKPLNKWIGNWMRPKRLNHVLQVFFEIMNAKFPGYYFCFPNKNCFFTRNDRLYPPLHHHQLQASISSMNYTWLAYLTIGNIALSKSETPFENVIGSKKTMRQFRSPICFRANWHY